MKYFAKNKHWLIPLMVVFFGSTMLMSVGLSERSFWTDEWYVFRYFDLTFLEFIKNYWTHPDNHPPGFYALVLLSIKIFGQTDWAVRLPALAGGVLSSVATYGITAHVLRKKWAPVFVALTAAGAPYLLGLSQTARYFSLAAGLGLVAIYAVLKILQTEHKKWFIGYAVALLLLGYIDYPSVVYVALSTGLFLLWYAYKRKSKRLFKLLLFSAVVVAFALAPLVPIALREAAAEAAYGSDVLSGGVLAWVIRIGSYVYVFFYGLTSYPWNAEVTIPIVLLLGVGASLVIKRRKQMVRALEDVKIKLLLWSAVFILGLNTFLLSMLDRYSPIAYPRYGSVGLYLLFIIVGIFISKALTHRKRLALAVIMMIVIVHGVGLYHYKVGDRFFDAVFFTRDKELYSVLSLQSQQGDFLWLNEDLVTPMYHWYADRYFSNVAILNGKESPEFFEENPDARVWVFGYGYDDKISARPPKHKAQEFLEHIEEGAARVSMEFYGQQVDARFKRAKEKVAGYKSYDHPSGLFLVTAERYE